ncbi:unnamed protein product, partial [Prorocentrum cordatum]
MLEAWERPEAGGPSPLAHVDLFAAFALARAAATAAPPAPPDGEGVRGGAGGAGGGEASASAGERLEERLRRWFCVPSEAAVDRAAQREKLEAVHGSWRPGFQRACSLEDLRRLDDVLSRNAEEFTGAVAVFGCGRGERAPWLARRRFQGLFPCKDLIQHSCAPNCASVAGPVWEGCERLVLEVVPLRTIRAGERLTWCYLPYWKALWPAELRRSALRDGWDFVCGCERCDGATREAAMAFRCPACGSSELCPPRPAALKALPTLRPAQTGCAGCAGVEHAAAAAEVPELQCPCGLRLGEGGASTPGGLKERLAQECAALALPWRGALGRDPGEATAEEESLLGASHWLIADHASHLLENAPAVLEALGLSAPGADPRAVEGFLQRLAGAVDTVLDAARRCLGPGPLQAPGPEPLLLRALCTGSAADFEACRRAHGHLARCGTAGAAAAAAAARLCASPAGFVAEGLGLQPAAAGRLQSLAGRAATPAGGGYAIYWYEGDDYGHERILLREVKSLDDRRIWVGASPDFDVYAEEWDTTGDRGPIRVELMKGRTVPRSFPRPIYRFDQKVPWGKFTELRAEASQVIVDGGLEEIAHARVQADPADALGSDGVWVASEPVFDGGQEVARIGTQVAKESVASSLGNRGFAKFGSVVAALERIKVEELDGYFAGRKNLLLVGLGGTHTPEEREGALGSPTGLQALRGALAGPQLPGTGEEPDEKTDEDVRALSVKFNAFNRRERVWVDSVKEMVEDAFSDWPLDGPRAFLWLMMSFAQLAMVPTFWLERHLQTAGWSENDRSIHEMRMMAEVFELAISYDQLNVASLAAFERLGRRWQAILEAHGKSPMNPNYEIADKFSGYNRRAQLVAPALRTYVAKEVREEAEIDRQTSKAKALRDEAKVALKRGKSAGKGKDKEDSK